ncbi:MAG: rod shape-determining protein MreC [Planctomycetota bacterium]|jgi:rod shape-determining protein MreC
MVRPQNRVSGRILLTWFILAGLIFLFAPQNLTNEFQFVFARIFRWPLSIGRGISLSSRTEHSFAAVVSLRKYNRLRNHLANITEWLAQERQKVEELSGLHDRPVWKGANFVLADVITVSGNSHNRLIINRGESDGLAKGQFVLGDYSIIGAISDVDSRTAVVKLFTDPTSKIAVKIEGLNVDRVIQGNGNNSARVQHLAAKHKVKTGVVVYAGKKPGFLDVPMIIGTVAECKRGAENPLLWDIIVRPACDIERLSTVNVIIMNPQE